MDKLSSLLAEKIIELVPTEDLQCNIHAKWIHGTDGVHICSNCNGGYQQYYVIYNFCPWCGAKMDLKEDEKE